MTDASLEYVYSSRARYLRISVRHDGRVRVTIPRRGSEAEARVFVEKQREWIERARRRVEAIDSVRLPSISPGDYPKQKQLARECVHGLLSRFAPQYSLSWESVRIKRMKTRWGSCSKRGNLNFNIHIIHLPPHLQEYLVVHELCHLREMNHSVRFWKLVEQTIPDFVARRSELRSAYRLR